MQKKSFVTLLAIMLVFGLAFIACDNGNGDNEKKSDWVKSWPDSTVLANFGISGLTQPSGTTDVQYLIGDKGISNGGSKTSLTIAYKGSNTEGETVRTWFNSATNWTANGTDKYKRGTNTKSSGNVYYEADIGWLFDMPNNSNMFFIDKTVWESDGDGDGDGNGDGDGDGDSSFTFEYELGDTGPGGGKIFYRSGTGFTMTDDNSTAHYLEAAPNNMTTTLNWCLYEYYNTNIAGTATGIGSGRKNTTVILTTDQNAYAALACKNYTYNGKSDWFLPSKDELNEIYKSKDSVGNLGTSSYWSSSQYDNRSVWTHSFSTGSQNMSDKSSAIQVRAVRAF